MWQRALIVFAGPATNFLAAFLIYVALFAMVYGQRVTAPVIATVEADSVGDKAGLLKWGTGSSPSTDAASPLFDMMIISRSVQDRPGMPLQMDIVRGGQAMTIDMIAAEREEKDRFGGESAWADRHWPGSARVARKVPLMSSARSSR